jgi:two-component system NarL family sensor kinase
MTREDEKKDRESAVLHKRAEQQRSEQNQTETPDGPNNANVASLNQELQIYQAELEIQKEELRQTQVKLEEAHNKYAELYDFAPIGYIITNERGLIVEANLTAAKMLGLARSGLQWQMLRRFVHESDQDAYYLFHQKLFKEKLSQQIQLRLYCQDGTTFYALLEGLPVTSEHSALVSQARIAISDISEMTDLQDRVERTTDELIVTEAALKATSEAHTKVQTEVGQRQQIEAELRFLLKLIENVNAATDFDEALRYVLEAMCIQEERIYGEVWLPNQKGTFLTLSPVFHLEEPQNGAIMQFRKVSEALKIAPGDGVAGQAWQLGKLLWIEDIAKLPSEEHLRQETQVAAGLHALLAVPITAAGKIVAVLLLYKDIPNKRNERFLALASAAAMQLGFVLQEKRAERRLQEAHSELEERVDERTAELHHANVALEGQIKEWEEAEERLRQRNQELELLHRFSLIITGRLDIDEILQPFANLLQEELHIPGGFVFFYDRRRLQIYPQLSWGLSEAEARDMIRWPLDENPLFKKGRREMALHYHLQEVPFFVEQGLVEAHPNWQSFMGMPVTVGDRTFGAFGLFSQAPATFRTGELAFFKALAQVIRTAVQNARLFEIVNNNREQLRRIARRVFSTQEIERLRVSRELHDEAGQALTGLKIHLEIVLATLKQVETIGQNGAMSEIEQQINTAITLCQTTLDQVRTIAHNLRPAALENLGLNTALQAFARAFAQRTQINVAYNGLAISNLPEAVEIGLYRFLQEALTNVVRHAQAKSMQVQLQSDANTISLTVVDDGQGFDVPHVLSNLQYKEGVGLAGMKERIESVGGQLTITSEIGKGTTLIAWIPL